MPDPEPIATVLVAPPLRPLRSSRHSSQPKGLGRLFVSQSPPSGPQTSIK